MDSLPGWAVSIIAVVVGLSPGLAIPSARRIARLLHRLLRPRPEVAGRSEHEPAQGRTGWVSSHTRVRGGTDGFVDHSGVRAWSHRRVTRRVLR